MTLASLLKTSAAALLLSAPAAFAATTTFTGSYTVAFNSADPGLVVNVAPSSSTGSFDLDVGQSLSFNIFDLWTTEATVNADDTVAKPISVGFALTAPASGSGTATGTTAGVSHWFGAQQFGTLDWDGPLMLSFGNTGLLQIELSDATFQPGFFGLSDPFGTYTTCQFEKGGHGGKKKVCTENTVFYGAEVMAKITYVAADTPDAPAPVPLPAAGLGLVAGLGALGLLRRKG